MKKRFLSLGIMIMMGVTVPINDYVYAEVISEIEQDVYDTSERIEYTYNDYVIDLINQMGENTTEENWKNNLSYLKDNYETIKKLSGVKMNLVDYYISEYSSQLEYENYISQQKDVEQFKVNDSKNNSIQSYTAVYSKSRSSVFFATSAVAYAKKYYNEYNSEYPNWDSYGGDCANFVSQCLVAGGLDMENGNSNTALNWYSYGNKCDTTQVSSSFRGANAFKNRFLVRAKNLLKINKGKSREYLFNNTNLGDAISFCKTYSDGTTIAKHTMIVVRKDYSSKTVYLAGHTGSTFDRDFYAQLNNYDCCYVFSMYK